MREELLKVAKPILYNTMMVQAILRREEPKTATRRLIKGYIPPDARFGYTIFTPEKHISCRGTFSGEYGEKFFKLPYKKNDILYVREAWAQSRDLHGEFPEYIYRADHEADNQKWCPSIHMPKEAARIFIKVTDVRVEHIKGMKLTDFLKEGVILRPEAFNDPENAYWQARTKFREIWDNTIKKADFEQYKFDVNPFVWVIEVERIEDI